MVFPAALQSLICSRIFLSFFFFLLLVSPRQDTIVEFSQSLVRSFPGVLHVRSAGQHERDSAMAIQTICDQLLHDSARIFALVGCETKTVRRRMHMELLLADTGSENIGPLTHLFTIHHKRLIAGRWTCQNRQL